MPPHPLPTATSAGGNARAGNRSTAGAAVPLG
jgi:hypothetical protein